MRVREIGFNKRIVAGWQEASAWMPDPLPPSCPQMALEGRLASSLGAAETALARLNQAVAILPCMDMLTHALLARESVISSQIEGTRATLLDLFEFEAEEGLVGENAVSTASYSASADMEEVRNHVRAVAYARSQLARHAPQPLSVRMLNGTHRLLMKGARGAGKRPGLLRRSQIPFGLRRPGRSHIVPPHMKIGSLLRDFESYMNGEDALPALIRVGLLHAQFASIHPYLGGNGRMARILVSLLLEHWGLLDEPVLCFSLFVKRREEEYRHRLEAIRTEGDWRGWLVFFLAGVEGLADEAFDSICALSGILERDRRMLLSSDVAWVYAMRLHDHLMRHPVVTSHAARMLLGTSEVTAKHALDTLRQVRILKGIEGRGTNRSFSYGAYLRQLARGAELR